MTLRARKIHITLTNGEPVDIPFETDLHKLQIMSELRKPHEHIIFERDGKEIDFNTQFIVKMEEH